MFAHIYSFSLPAVLMHWLITWTLAKINTGKQTMFHLWQFRGSTKPYIFIIQKNVPSLRITLVWWWRRWIPPLAGINIGAGNPPYPLAWDTYQALDIYILSNFQLFLICGVQPFTQSSMYPLAWDTYPAPGIVFYVSLEAFFSSFLSFLSAR